LFCCKYFSCVSIVNTNIDIVLLGANNNLNAIVLLVDGYIGCFILIVLVNILVGFVDSITVLVSLLIKKSIYNKGLLRYVDKNTITKMPLASMSFLVCNY